MQDVSAVYHNKVCIPHRVYRRPLTQLSVIRHLYAFPSKQGSDRRASFPVTRVDYACLQLKDIKADPINKGLPGNWFRAKVKSVIARISNMSRLTMATGLALAIFVVLVLRWLSTGAPPVVAAPANDTLVSSSRWKGAKEYHEAAHKYVVDVLAFGSF